MTQSELARAIDIPRVMTISEWERDVRPPPPDRLLRLADALDVSAGWLLTGEGEGPAEAA